MAVVRKRVVLLGLRSLEQEIMFVAIWKEIQRAGERGRERERERFLGFRERKMREIPWALRKKERFPGLRENSKCQSGNSPLRETQCPAVCWQSDPEVDVTVVSR